MIQQKGLRAKGREPSRGTVAVFCSGRQWDREPELRGREGAGLSHAANIKRDLQIQGASVLRQEQAGRSWAKAESRRGRKAASCFSSLGKLGRAGSLAQHRPYDVQQHREAGNAGQEAERGSCRFLQWGGWRGEGVQGLLASLVLLRDMAKELAWKPCGQ